MESLTWNADRTVKGELKDDIHCESLFPHRAGLELKHFAEERGNSKSCIFQGYEKSPVMISYISLLSTFEKDGWQIYQSPVEWG